MSIGRKPKNLPDVGNFADNSDENSFRFLYEEYKNNDYDDEYVACLKCLEEDERNLLLLYIVDDCCYAKLSRRFHVSAPWMKAKIDEIRRKIVAEHERQEGESEYYLKPKIEKKKPVVQTGLFNMKIIGIYSSPEEASRAVNGDVYQIRKVCNNYGKYKNFRWFWLEYGKIYNNEFILRKK